MADNSAIIKLAEHKKRLDEKAQDYKGKHLALLTEQKTLIEDILIEQWQANEHGRTIANAIEIMANDFDEFKHDFKKFVKDFFGKFGAGKIAEPVAEVDDRQLSFEGLGMTPSQLQDAELEKDRDRALLKNIDKNVNDINQYFQELKRNKKGGTGDPTTNKPPKDDGFSFSDLLAGYFSFKLFKKNFGKIFTKFSGFIGKQFSKLFSSIGKYFTKFFPKTSEFLGKLFPKMLSSISKYFTKFFPKTAGILGKVFSKAAIPILKKFSVLLVKNIPYIGWAIAIGDAIWDFFKGFNDDAAAELLGKKKDALTTWDKVTSGLTSLIQGFTLGFVDKKTILPYAKKFTSAFKSIWDSFTDMLPKSIKKSLIDPIIKGFKKVFSGLWDKIKKSVYSIGQSIVDVISNAFQNFKSGAFEKGSQLLDFSTMIIDRATAFLQSIVDIIPASVTDFISDKIEKLLSDANPFSSELTVNDKTSTAVPRAALDYMPLESRSTPIDTSTSKNTDEIAKMNFLNMNKKPEQSQPIVIQQSAQKSAGGSAPVVDSARDSINRSLNSGKQFGVIN